MICKKRGPLGACLETTIRTADNDNDKANKYFKDPSEKVKAKQAQMISSQEEDNDGNALIQKLRKQSLDNKEKNDLIVRQKTLLNDQVRSLFLCVLCGDHIVSSFYLRAFKRLTNEPAMQKPTVGKFRPLRSAGSHSKH